MAAPTSTRGLSPADLDQIRAALASGRKPKVVFTAAAGQIAGQAGHVSELTDPAGSDEWIVVQFGKDELPFSPSDLALPIRGAAKTVPARTPNGRRTTTQAATSAPEPEPALAPAPAAPKGIREGKSMQPVNLPPAPAAEANGNARANGNNNGTAHANSNGNADAAKTAKPKPAKAPASLVVTLSYADREWTIGAMQGAKALAKPYVIRPAEALRMVALIDVPGVHEAVESIIANERAEAEGRAQRLRSELAEIETRLAELGHNA
jgi:hypothetical protein